MSAVFGFRLPEDLRQYLQRQAARQRTTVSHYLVMLVMADMEQDSKQTHETAQKLEMVENGKIES